MTDELKALLGASVQDVALAPDQAARAVTGAREQQRRWAVTGTALALAVVGAGTAVVLAVGGEDTDTLVPARPAVDSTSLLVRDGDRVTGSGRVVQVLGSPPVLCDSRIGQATPGYVEEPAPGGCGDYGTRLVGTVDLQGLAERREKDGAVEGTASLTGVLRGGVLTVEEQGPPLPVADLARRDFAKPPCRAPEGGWPRGAAEETPGGNLSRTPLAALTASNPGLVVTDAQATPERDTPVLVVLARDEQARDDVEAALGPSYPALCVTVATYARDDVDAAYADASREMSALKASSSGTGLGQDWQEQVQVELPLVDARALALAQRHPAGLIALSPMLRPVR